MFAGEGGNLGVEGGNFNGDDLDFGPLQALQVLLEAAFGFRFAQDGFAEEIDVHADAFAVAFAQVMREHFLLPGKNDVGGFLLHVLLDQREGHAGDVAAKGLEALHERAIHRAEKARDALHIEDVDQMFDGAGRFVGAEGLIGHLGQSGLVGRGLEHAVQFGLLAALGGGLQLRGALLQTSRQKDGLLRLDGMAGIRVGIKVLE